jgi:hypothetical protein
VVATTTTTTTRITNQQASFVHQGTVTKSQYKHERGTSNKSKKFKLAQHAVLEKKKKKMVAQPLYHQETWVKEACNQYSKGQWEIHEVIDLTVEDPKEVAGIEEMSEEAEKIPPSQKALPDTHAFMPKIEAEESAEEAEGSADLEEGGQEE